MADLYRENYLRKVAKREAEANKKPTSTCPRCDSELGEVLFDGNRYLCWTETDRDGVVTQMGRVCLRLAPAVEPEQPTRLDLADAERVFAEDERDTTTYRTGELAFVDRIAELKAALRATNAEIIRYGTSPDTYDWADMTARTRANAKIVGD